MDPVNIISQYYEYSTRAYEIMIQHGRKVAQKAVAVSRKVINLSPDINFIIEAAMFHDI